MAEIQIDIEAAGLGETAKEQYSAIVLRGIEAAKTIGSLKIAEPAELSILLTDDAQLQSLNKQWRGMDKPTNVLSFPGDDISPDDVASGMLGDIAVSLDTMKREAALENKNPNDHFSHLIIHGFLHLFGYDHENDDEAEVMESLETKILATLGIADPYEST